MAGFEDFRREERELEHEIAIRLQLLGVDIEDEGTLRQLAHEALSPHQTPTEGYGEDAIKRDLFGLSALMLKAMTESAEEGRELHGGPVWKAFGKALWEASGLRD